METELAANPSEPGARPAGKSSCLRTVLACVGLVVVLLGLLWWWQHRPIRPVVLSGAERQAVENKMAPLEAERREDAAATAAGTESATAAYQPGSREIVLSEREINGLLHDRTGLGDRVRFDFEDRAVHARVETDLDAGLPLVGGKRLKMRARFRVESGEGGAGFALEDLTVWGISVPNEWLGGLKGQDLLGELFGARGGRIPGVEEIRAEKGRLVIQLAE